MSAFFGFQLKHAGLMLEALNAFVRFSLVASAVYIFNDWIDRHEDAQCSEKKSRPLAAGRIKTPLVFAVLVFLMIGGVSADILVSSGVFFLILTYLAVSFAYTLRLKHIAIVDVGIIVSGFVISLLVGAEAKLFSLLHWMIVIAFLFVLFLSLAMRRDDVMVYLKADAKMRKVIHGYNLKFLDVARVVSVSIVLVAYILWSIFPDVAERLNTQHIYLGGVFVVHGVMRYMQIAFVEEKAEILPRYC